MFPKKLEIDTILDSINDGFYIIDANWKFVYANKAFAVVCECTKEEVIGINYWDKFPKARKLKFYSEFHKAMKERVNVHFEEYASSFSKWISVNAYPYDDGLAVYFTDITTEKNDLLTIQEQNRQLKEIAWIQSHKVRGPVARMLGLQQLFNTKDPGDPLNARIINEMQAQLLDLDLIIRDIDARATTTEKEVKSRIRKR